jgi:hypothetical protein
MMQFRRNLQRPFRNFDPDADSNGGGFVATPDTTPDTTPEATPPGEGAVDSATGPANMLEAMFGQQKPASPEEAAEAAAAGKSVQQLRDEKGRFAGKAPEADPLKPAPKPAQPDPNAMPEGLTPKAQERFQQLANTNRELTSKVQEWQPIVDSALELQRSFHANGVKQEQFEMAMQVVGLMNRGDLRGALSALDEQRKLISLHLGEPLPGANALADYPDLQQAVENLQITEAHALELARGRMVSGRQQQAQQAQQREEQTAQQIQQAERSGQLEVDKFCKARMADDLDYAKIEPLLIEQIKDGLLQGIPPQRWPAIVEKTYRVIKQTAAQSRVGGPSTTVLRPTGGESVRQAPKTMHEAMWGSKQP